MPRRINPIRKMRIKQGLMKHHGNARKALQEAGASKYVINHSTTDKCVKVCIEEILAEFKQSDVTVESVLKELEETRLLALKEGDYSTAARCSELKGKYLAMFTTVNKEELDISIGENQEAIRQRLELLGVRN